MSGEVQQKSNLTAEEKRALLARLLQQKAAKSATFPLSFAQERLWFLNQLDPNNTAYNLRRVIRICGNLDVNALQQSLQTIVNRHELLRTRFVREKGSPMQVIAENMPVVMPVINLSEHPAATREAEAWRLAVETAQQPFDLAQGPLFRTALLRLGDNDHIFILIMHHIIADDWSHGVLFQELSLLYESFSAGEPMPLPQLPIQYADYAAWQRQWLQGEIAERQLSYWKEQLSEIPAIHELPTDHPRPPVQTFRGARASRIIPASLVEKLKILSRQEGVTLFMTLLAVYKILLWRYSAQKEIVVGSPIAGRNRSELEGLIGFFLNTIVLRTDLSDNPTFKTLLAQVREVCLGAYAHQDIPFEKVVEELKPERHLGYQPLFQVMFVFHNALLNNLNLPDLHCTPLWIDARQSVFDLTLFAYDEQQEFKLIFEYNTDIFEAATIERILEHYVNLFEGIVAEPETQIAELPLLGEAEREQLLVGWNETSWEYPKDKSLQELFERQVERTPEATAIIFGEEELSYRELNVKANQVAHYLKKRGVAKEVLVGICLERSLEMVAGLLGILKAGGAYLPLDPNYPEERLAFMVADSGIPVLLTQEKLLDKVPGHQAKTICLDQEWRQIQQESEENPQSGITGENLAYAIYTSGSTGKPKGVLGLHQGAINRFEWMWERYPFEAGEVCCQKTTLNFVDSIWEIFGPLLQGIPIVIISEEGVKDPSRLVEELAQHEVTRIVLVPSLLRAMLETNPELGSKLSRLKTWVTSGEAISKELAERFQEEVGPSSRLINLYGSSEVSADVTYYEIGAMEENERSIPIGRPIANTQIYLLDKEMKPVPIGVGGEIYVGGEGLARGYLNRAELTKEKFVANPYRKRERLYRTGDIGRYRGDGQIEYVGRVDHQVKIRGNRVEIGEVEVVLSQNEGVAEVVVVAQEDTAGDNYLAAYIVPGIEPPPTVSDLRGYLKQKLADYMIPTAYVMLDELPLTPNGKVDRRALPAPENIRPDTQETYIAPRDELELQLTKIWEDVLNIRPVGIRDDFFDLGGHSLLAVRLFAELEKVFGKNLPLATLFQAPTIEQLVGVVHDEGWQSPSLISPTSREGDIPLSFAQERLWFLDQLEPGNSTYNMALAYRLKGSLNVAVLEQSFNQIVACHESLRTTFSAVNGQPVQHIAPKLTLSLPMFDLSTLPESEREARVQEFMSKERKWTFTLDQGPLLRTTLLQLDVEEYILLLTMHHIISDAWSLGVLFDELAMLYEAYTAGNEVVVPELPIQYADFAVWQREWLQGDVLKPQLDYWRQQLSDRPLSLELPTDRPRPTIQTHQGAMQSITLPQALSEALQTLNRQEGATLFMTLLTAFNVLLYRHSGQEDISIGAPIANRNQPEIQKLIGIFLNTLVLRTDLSGTPSFRELLSRVKKVALDAYTYQDIPFEKIVEDLQPKRDLGRTPLFQVFFNMYNYGSNNNQKLELKGMTTEYLSLFEPDSKFDLTLYVRERHQELQFILVYNAALFDSDRMASFLHQYQHLLEQIVATPEKPISAYSLLAPEASKLLPNPGIPLNEPKQGVVAEMIDGWAQKTPNQPAISQGKQTWSYAELIRQAKAVAQQLQAEGLQQGDTVAVYGLRSFGLMASMIGALLGGGVLLLIERNLPNQRKQLMLQAGRAKKLLHVGARQPGDSWLEDLLENTLFVDAISGAVDTKMAQTLETISLPKMAPDDAAYIFFTSGTTGAPKGVMGSHKGLSHFVNWQRETFAIGPGDRSSQLTGLSFDVVLREIFLPLTSGATLCLPEDTDTLGSDETMRWLERERISVLHTVPTLAQYWLADNPSEVSLDKMRWIFFAGEPLTEALIGQWRNAFPESKGEIINLYGPTETTLAKCFYQVPNVVLPGVQPVGQPLPQTQALVLGPNNQLCGIGELGEIVLRTPFRTLGYINAPEENQKRFVKNPFRNDEQDLLYYTGDRGRYRPDGTLEILGRLDDQVKIRGVRVEPNEVNATLAQYPAVKSCFVMAEKDEQEQYYLIAYVVAQKQAQVTVSDLRTHLSKYLPATLVPAAFVFLEQMPRTPNGKVDRRALPAPDEIKQESSERYVAPRDELELQLTKIWENVLNVQPVGVRDDFFQLGGHSLLAVRLFARLEKVFGKNLPLATLFQAPTIEQLVEILRDEGWQAPWTSLVPIQPQGSKPPFFCVHAVGGNVLSLRDLAQHLGADQPFYALQSQGLNGKERPPARVEEMAAYYIEEMRTVQPEGPYYLGGQSSGGLIAFEMARQLQAQGKQIAILALIDTYDPLDRKLSVAVPFRNKVSFHLHAFSQLGSTYVREWTRYRLKRMKFQLERGRAEIIKKIYARLERPVPQRIRYTYVRETIRQALKSYTPQNYKGRITLFRATNTIQAYLEDLQQSQRGWVGLATEGLETYDIPGAHNLEKEPYVGILAEKLSACIHKAQNIVNQQTANGAIQVLGGKLN